MVGAGSVYGSVSLLFGPPPSPHTMNPTGLTADFLMFFFNFPVESTFVVRSDENNSTLVKVMERLWFWLSVN